MSVKTSARFFRWVVPCFSLLLVLCCAGFLSSEAARSKPLQAALHREVTTPEVLEASLGAKAERVLEGFGESDPVAVVTVALTSDWEDVEAYLPQRETRTLEAIQTTGESMKGENEYRSTKAAENYAVGFIKTTTHKAGPRLQRLSCLVQVSEKNAHRLDEIEQAVSVALGADVQRGDQVMASVQ